MIKTFVFWLAEAVSLEMKHLIRGGSTEDLRRFQQQLDRANEIWRSWAVQNDGSVLQVGCGEGILEVPSSKLKDLPAIRQQVGEALESDVSMGIGTEMSEAELALKAAKLRGGEQTMLYGPHVHEIIAAAEQKHDPLEDVLGKLQKAMHDQHPASPVAPAAEASEHSEAEGMRSAISAAAEGAPASPEMTHAASPEDAFHQLAGDQDQKDQQDAQSGEQSKAAIKAAIASVLKQVKGQAQAFAQLQPEFQKAITGLIQGVIAMAHAMDEGQPIQKSEKLEKAEPPKTLGHTSSGEPIYTAAHHLAVLGLSSGAKGFGKNISRIETGQKFHALHADWTAKDHEEAQHAHSAAAAGDWKHPSTAFAGLHARLAGHLQLQKGKLPMPQNKSSKHPLKLPTGSMKQGFGEHPKVKVEHGEGGSSWKQVGSGMITTTADRHAPPVIGTASHPVSSRNPKAR